MNVLRHYQLKTEKGFSLVEVLASIVIISIVLIGVLNLIIFTNKTAVTNNDKLVAINLAKATIERMKIQPEDYFPLPTAGSEPYGAVHYDGVHCTSEECKKLYNVLVNDVTYNVTVSVSQNEEEINRLHLINAVVRVDHPDKKVSSIVEGYISYD